MAYYFENLKANHLEYGRFKTKRLKESTLGAVMNVIPDIRAKFLLSDLQPRWINKNTFGWVLVNGNCDRQSAAVIGNGYKRLYEKLKDEYYMVVFSNNARNNFEERDLENGKALLIDLSSFREFIQTFSSSSDRVDLFLHRFDSEEQKEAVNRWWRSWPKEKPKPEPITEDIFNQLARYEMKSVEEVENFKDKLDIILENKVVENHKLYRERLDQFKAKIDDKNIPERDLSDFLKINPWIISPEYARLKFQREAPTEKGNLDLYYSERRHSVQRDIVIELKRPIGRITLDQKTGKKVIVSAVGRALSQCIEYLSSSEVGKFSKGIVIIGRETDNELIEKINSHLHNIEILTYGNLYDRADKLLKMFEVGEIVDGIQKNIQTPRGPEGGDEAKMEPVENPVFSVPEAPEKDRPV